MTDPFAPTAIEPVNIMLGDFHAWTINDSFDPTKYSLKYLFSQGETSFTLAGSVVDGLWTFTANGAFTSALPIGRVHLDLIVTRLLDMQDITLRASTVQCFELSADRTSHAQIMVDKIQSILLGRADSDVDSYTIRSRSISKMSVKELIDWREYYLAELGREPDPISGKASKKNTVKVRFI